MTRASLTAPRSGASAVASSAGHTILKRLAWLLALFLWAAVAASLISFDPADPPSHLQAPLHPTNAVANWLGPVGARLAYELFLMLGSGVWVILIGAAVGLAAFAARGRLDHPVLRSVGVIVVGLAFSGFHALWLPSWTSFPEGGGGLIARTGVHELALRFGTLGTGLWLALLAVIGLTVAFDNWLAAAARLVVAPVLVLTRVRPALAGVGGAVGRVILFPARERANDIDDDQDLRRVSDKMRDLPAAVASADASAGDEDAPDDTDSVQAEAPAEKQEDAADAHPEGVSAESAEPAVAPPIAFDPEELRRKIARLPVRFACADRRAAREEDLELLRSQRLSEEEADKKYVFPGLDLLTDPEAGYEQELEAYVREQAQALETALNTYNIRGEVVGIESGPVITLYQVRLAPGTKVSSITAVASDIARALKAVNIRVVPNTEGLDTVGVEVPNRKKEKVRLKELMTRSDATSKMRLPLFLGKDASGRPLIVDLAALPHLLIAGTTGSGKSVCMNAIIVGFLYTQKPSDLKLALVDPKVVELSQFKDIPHLMCPVVTDMSKAAAMLEWAMGKMDERYELLAEAGCRDIAAYNALSWDELKERFGPRSEAEEARIPRKLPYMVFIIDELADLIMTRREVEGSIVRIAQKARAVGIHLILATQRPQANVVTGLIKSNMPGRLSFKVASGMDSRIVLDQKGGELLLGQGDMLFLTPRSATPIRAQGTLVDDAEIRQVVRFVRQVSSPSFERQLVQLRSGPTLDSADPEDHEQRMLENAQEDPLFDRAVEIVLETRRGSVSLLQRRLAIGYTRASRLIELMGQAGIIGGHKGSVAREVVMTLDEWHAMKQLAQADARSAEPTPAAVQPALFPETGEAAPPAAGEPESDLRTESPDSGEAARISPQASSGDDLAVKESGPAPAPSVGTSAQEEDDDEYEYEYEYVEVEEGQPLGEDVEVVDEAPPAPPPEIVIAEPKAGRRQPR